MGIVGFKILTIVTIFPIGLLAGLSPLRFDVSETGQRRLALGNAFAGGVFLGAGLLHLLPDGNENFGTLLGDVDFPFAMLLCGAGFLLVLLIEQAFCGGDDQAIGKAARRPVYPFILCFILSVHSVIAGTSLGLEAALLAAVALYIAIIAHKGAAAFALGASLKTGAVPRRRHIMLTVLFAAMTPLGVAVGTVCAALLAERATIGFEAVFDSLAAGTFLYVAVVDILADVFAMSRDRWTKLVLVAAGFGIMALIAIWA